MTNMYFFFLLLFSTCAFAAEIPFMTFSNAVLSVSNEEIITYSNKFPVCYPLFSGNLPQFVKKNDKAKIKQVEWDCIQAKQIDGDALLIVDHDVMFVGHYFHCMEHLLGIWNFLAYHNPDAIKTILIAYRASYWDATHHWKGGGNDTTFHLLTSLFPNATIGLMRDLPANVKAKQIHVSSRPRSNGIQECSDINMLGSSRYAFHPERLRQMRDRIFNSMSIEVKPRQDVLRIMYCKRSTGRILDLALEQMLLDRIVQETGHPVHVVDFALLSFREQLQIVANTDLLIGVHGNGLTHLLFLPDNAAILEYFEGGESAFFRLFAQLRGVHYFGNSHQHWVTGEYQSIDNKAPYQASVTGIDIDNSIHLIKSLFPSL